MKLIESLKSTIKHSNDSGSIYACGSNRFNLLVLIIFLAGLFWLKDGFLKIDSSGIDIKTLIGFIIVALLLFLMAWLPNYIDGKKAYKKFLYDAWQKRWVRILLNQISLIVTALTATACFGFYAEKELAKIFTNHSFVYFARIFILVFLFAQVLYLIINKLWLVHDIVVIIAIILAAVEYYVISFRTLPFYPWDVFSVSAAADVAGGYAVVCTRAMIFCICALLLSHQFILLLRWGKEERSLFKAFSNIIVFALAIVIYFVAIPTVNLCVYSGVADVNKYGTLPTCIAYTKYQLASKPEGYSDAKAKSIIKKSNKVDSLSDTQAVNVICIMNESFADFRTIDPDMEWEYTPFIDSLNENCIKGNLYVSTFGAGTCNTEYEFLTASSLIYNRGNPYTTYFKKNHSVASTLLSYEKAGFTCDAFHPWWSNSWNRKTVYSDLKFSKFYSMQDEGQFDILLNGPSDSEDFTYLENMYNNKPSNKYFVFNVTMQNHGGFDSDDSFEKTVDLSQYGDFNKAETYLTLLKESDSAFEDLVNYYKSIDQPTIICMFGDHMPALEKEYFDMLYGQDSYNLSAEDNQKMYETPFVIWANYDIGYTYIDKISSNFLGLEVMRAAGIEMSDYESYAYSVYEKYPVISLAGIYDKDGNFYEYNQEAGALKSGILKDYGIANYYHINKELED